VSRFTLLQTTIIIIIIIIYLGKSVDSTVSSAAPGVVDHLLYEVALSQSVKKGLLNTTTTTTTVTETYNQV